MKSRRAPHQAPHSQTVTATDDKPSLTDRPVKRARADISSATAAAEQPVNPGAGHTPAGCSQGGQAGNPALAHHQAPGEQVASSGGRAPAPPKTPSDQQQCPPFSLSSRREIEKRGHRPRPRPECGTTWAGPSKADPGEWLARWYPDRTMSCPHCGPWIREQKAAAYLERIGDTPLVRRLVTDAAWPSTTRKYRREQVDYWQCPFPGGWRLVLATSGPGEPVTDNAAELRAAIAAYPAGEGRNISASKAWQIPAAKPVPVSDDRKRYDMRYLVGAGLEHARQVAHDLEVYGQEVGRDGAAFTFRMPTDQLARRRLIRWMGLQDPEELRERRRPGKRQRGEAA